MAADKDVSCVPIIMYTCGDLILNQRAATGAALSHCHSKIQLSLSTVPPVFLIFSILLNHSPTHTCVYSSLIPHTHGPQKVLFACPIKYPLNFPKVAHIIKITILKKPFQQQRSLVFYLILVVAKAVRIKAQYKEHTPLPLLPLRQTQHVYLKRSTLLESSLKIFKTVSQRVDSLGHFSCL